MRRNARRTAERSREMPHGQTAFSCQSADWNMFVERCAHRAAITLSGELISRGLHFNAITAGPIATPLNRKLGMGENELKAPETQIPARPLGKPAEIAKAVVFLASDESVFVVGSELVIDGGTSNL